MPQINFVTSFLVRTHYGCGCFSFIAHVSLDVERELKGERTRREWVKGGVRRRVWVIGGVREEGVGYRWFQGGGCGLEVVSGGGV